MSTNRESVGGGGQFRDGLSHSPAPGKKNFSGEDRAALDEVLRETLDSLSHDKITQPELDALCEVARKHKNRSIDDEPVLIELVRVLLQKRFEFPSYNESEYESMSREIADCLRGAPALRQRLNQFWDRMRDSIQ